MSHKPNYNPVKLWIGNLRHGVYGGALRSVLNDNGIHGIVDIHICHPAGQPNVDAFAFVEFGTPNSATWHLHAFYFVYYS